LSSNPLCRRYDMTSSYPVLIGILANITTPEVVASGLCYLNDHLDTTILGAAVP